MTLDIVNRMTGQLTLLVEEGATFEARYGKQATIFLQHIPALFRLFHRMTFEFEVAVEQRRLAASVAVYIAEHQDFFGEAIKGVEGLIDDLWLAYRALELLLESVPEAVLQRHWLSDAPFDQVVALAHNVDSLAAHVPPRIFSVLHTFLGIERRDDG